jgi:hypothetical protein
MSATPTAPLSHPIAWYPVIGTVAAYGVELDDVVACRFAGHDHDHAESARYRP